MMQPIDKLVARSEIWDCQMRYARGVDRKDWPAVHACFHDGSVDEHADYLGDADGFIAWVSKRHATTQFSMHYMLNFLVDFVTPTQASVETYFWAVQRIEPKAEGETATDMEVFGRYVDIWEERGSGWKIARRKVVYDSTRQMPSTNHLRKVVGVLGVRGPTDPVYGLPTAAE